MEQKESAINAKTLAVEFSKALNAEEQKGLTFEVKKDGSTQLVKVDSFEGKTAKLVRTNNANFAAGEYAVTVKGLEKEATVKTKVEAQKETTLNVTSELLLDSTAKAKVGLELKDQYGEQLTVSGSDYTVTAYNNTQGKSVAIDYDIAEKSFVIDTAARDTDANNEFKAGDEVTVTFLHKTTGLKATKTLKVAAGSQLNSITLGEVQLPEGKTLLTEDLTNVKVAYSAKDQYGKAVELKAGDVEIISTDTSVVAPGQVTFTKEKDKTVLNIAKFGQAGKTNLILLNKVTGETSTIALEVNEKAGTPYGVALSDAAVEVAASGTKVVDLTITDKYGNKVEPKDYVGSAFTVASSNEGVARAAIETSAASDNYGELVITSTGSKGDKATITVTLNATGQTTKLDVTLGEAVAPFDLAVSKDSKHATSLVVGGSTTVDFDVFDQYNTKTAANGAYTVNYKLKNDADSEYVTLSGENTAITTSEVTVTANKAGSATLVAELKKGAEVIDTVEIPFTTVANSSKAFTYEVSDIAKLYNNGDGADTTLDAVEMGSNKHAQPIKVVAKSNGSTLTVPNSSILNVTPITTNVTVGQKDGVWYVAGSAPSITEDATGKIRINVATDEGTKTIEKEVSISKDAIQVKDLKAMDRAIASASTAKEKTQLVSSTYTGAIDLSTAGIYLWTVDQFGVKADFDVANADTVSAAAFKGIKFTSDDTFVKSADTVTVSDVIGDTTAEAGSSYRLTIIENGVALDLPVTVTAAKAQTAAFLATQDINATAAALATPTISANGLNLGALPTTDAENGTAIDWTSAAEAVVTDAGVFVADGTENLTAEITKASGTTATVTFTVVAAGGKITSVTKN